MYETRKIVFDEEYEIIGVFEKQYDSKTIKKFINGAQVNKYKMYPVSTISCVAYPNKSDMTQARSALINNDGAYAGWQNID